MQNYELKLRNSRSCSSYGALTGPFGLHNLQVRNWMCDACGASHDRDINAAINTLILGQGMPSKDLVISHQKSYKTMKFEQMAHNVLADQTLQ